MLYARRMSLSGSGAVSSGNASATRGSRPASPSTANCPGVKLNSPASGRTRRINNWELRGSRPTTVAL
jgi:hypothetical protein